jgi:phosphatidylglycerophosphatase C
VLPLLPVILAGLAVYGRAARWPMSLLLGINLRTQRAQLKRLEANFVRWFRQHVTAFPVVQARLKHT